MKGNGKMTKQMDMEYILLRKEEYLGENGKEINKKGKDMKNGMMGESIKENIRMG